MNVKISTIDHEEETDPKIRTTARANCDFFAIYERGADPHDAKRRLYKRIVKLQRFICAARATLGAELGYFKDKD